jgi:Cu(I)/Ag(I) efflux system membrane fusion protein
VSGVVSERGADPGDKSDSDSAMFVISRQDRLKLTGAIPENAFMKLAPGAPATVEVRALPGQTFKASVTRVHPTIDVATRSGRIELGIDARGVLKPGLYAQGTIETGEHDGIVLPREVVRQLRGSPDWRVFLLRDDGTVEARQVTLGIDLGSRVEIAEGVGTDDRVIATQSDKLEEQNVRVEVTDE